MKISIFAFHYGNWMNLLKNRFLISAVLLAVFVFSAAAQDHTGAYVGYTPYSMFGIGQLAPQGTGFNSAKGGVGIADRNVRFINLQNPAAVTARESKSFMMDVGLRQGNTVMEANAAACGVSGDGTVRSANNTFNMNDIVLSFPIKGSAAFKFGIMPYSNVGYNFLSEETSSELLSGIGDIRYAHNGSGGTYQIFLGAGYTFLKRFSVGVDGYYYFGNINHNSYASISSTTTTYRGISTGWYYSLSGLGAKFGLQYEQPVGKQRAILFGATYSIPTRLGGEMVEYTFGELSSSTDTLHYNVSGVKGYDIPAELGLGITYKHSDKLTIGFDYRQQDWSNTDFGPMPNDNYSFSTANAQSFRLGAEWTPSRYDVRYYFKTLTYHAGLYYDRSYMAVNGHQVAAKGITLGVTFPVFRYYNSITLGIDLGQNGTLDNDLIRERYLKFTLSFNFHDIWFIKQLYE